MPPAGEFESDATIASSCREAPFVRFLIPPRLSHCEEKDQASSLHIRSRCISFGPRAHLAAPRLSALSFQKMTKPLKDGWPVGLCLMVPFLKSD